ncbi:MAG: EamA family transporter [Acidobacteriia bacterium]|nr:EamA family transporter [Terriglobia bacterium]
MGKKSSLAVPALVAAVVSWGSIPLFLKHFTNYMDAWTVNGARYLVGALLLLPALRRAADSDSSRSSLWRNAVIPFWFAYFDCGPHICWRTAGMGQGSLKC